MQDVIRDALPDDLPGILEIYNDAVLNTTAIWNERPVDLANRQAWYAARQSQAYQFCWPSTTQARCWATHRLATGAPSKGFAIRWSIRSMFAQTSAARGWGRA